MDNNQENNQLVVSIDGENNITIDVIDIIENQDNNKKYIIYGIEDTDDVYMSILEETDSSFTLKSIEDEEEAKMIEDYLEELTLETGDE